MKPKAPHKTSPVSIAPLSVTIVRPAATVTVVINGTSHKMTEDEARALHQQIGQALNIKNPLDALRDQYDKFREPARWIEPRYITAPGRRLEPWCIQQPML